jgi:teichuronic acid biosynthesis glycosyltransferase TuaC
MNILVLTDTLPAPILAKKIRENDVLVTTADLHEQMYQDVNYTFVFLLYTTFFTHIFPKYKEHKTFLDLKSYNLKNRKIEIIAVPTFVKSNIFWSLYMKFAFLRNRSKLGKIIRENKIDVMHAQDMLTNLGIAYQINKYFKIPFVVTSRHVARADYIKPHIKRFVAKAQGVINLGAFEKSLTASMNPKSYLISHGISERFINQEKTFSNGKNLKIVTIARLLDFKNIDKIISALDLIKVGFTLNIYGDGPELEPLRRQVAKSSIADQVSFQGHVDYNLVPDILAEHDLFVLPSFRELFGRVYIEAMACGLPIIGARNTGMDGYITEGEQGFLVDHTDVLELRDAIQRFISDETLKVTMGRKAQAFAKAFSWDVVINKLDDVYRGLLAN